MIPSPRHLEEARKIIVTCVGPAKTDVTRLLEADIASSLASVEASTKEACCKAIDSVKVVDIYPDTVSPDTPKDIYDQLDAMLNWCVKRPFKEAIRSMEVTP